MTEPKRQPDPADSSGVSQSRYRTAVLTVPNVLCSARIIGSGILLAVAWAENHTAAFILTVALLVTDWLDGKLAVFLKQRSAIGPVLDSIADLCMYVAVIVSVLLLYPDVIARNWPWIAAVAGSYALTITAGLVKFHRWPSYHARLAKISWGAAAIGFIALFASWSEWPIRVAAALVTIGNLEGVAITLVLPRPETDVPSVFHALRLRR
jgi:cardiolipin synthase (CMP-forming)